MCAIGSVYTDGTRNRFGKLGCGKNVSVEEAGRICGVRGALAGWQVVDYGGSDAEKLQARSSKGARSHSGAHQSNFPAN